MTPLPFTTASAEFPSAEPLRLLRCPSCCSPVDLAHRFADAASAGWQVLHRCGDHVIEAVVRESGLPASIWRWRALGS